MSRRRLPIVLAVAFAARFAVAFPEPSRTPVSWELKFEPATPKRIVVQVPGESAPKAYWYVTYTVTNNTDADQNFLPSFEWVTKEGKIVRSDKGVPNAVFEKIKATTRNKLLENNVKIGGTLRQGEDQAKDGVAIWEETDPRLGDFSIFVGGLSGENVQLTDSSGKTMTDEAGKPVLLFKTLELDYRLAGDAVYAGNDLLIKREQKWVMR